MVRAGGHCGHVYREGYGLMGSAARQVRGEQQKQIVKLIEGMAGRRSAWEILSMGGKHSEQTEKYA